MFREKAERMSWSSSVYSQIGMNRLASVLLLFGFAFFASARLCFRLLGAAGNGGSLARIMAESPA